MEEGGCNSKYFHSLLRDKRRRLQLHRIKNHKHRWVQGDDKIAKAAIHHFAQLFNQKHLFKDYMILDNITCYITDEDNEVLTAIPDMDEIKDAIFGMSASSSAGPDGYNGTFYHKC